MDILMSKQPSYVRCIKPNHDKKPGPSLAVCVYCLLLLSLSSRVASSERDSLDTRWCCSAAASAWGLCLHALLRATWYCPHLGLSFNWPSFCKLLSCWPQIYSHSLSSLNIYFYVLVSVVWIESASVMTFLYFWLREYHFLCEKLTAVPIFYI